MSTPLEFPDTLHSRLLLEYRHFSLGRIDMNRVVRHAALLPLLAILGYGQSAGPSIERIIQSAKFKDAGAFIEGDHDRFVRELIYLTEIPSPPFKEAARAK